MNRLFKAICFFMAACLLAAMPLHAASYTWNLPSGSPGYVSVAANWNPSTGIPGGTTSDTATIGNGGTAVVDATHQFGGSFNTLTVTDSTLTLNAGATVNVATGGLNYNAGSGSSTLTIADGATLTSTGQFDLGHNGSVHVSLSGTSTTSPSKLSIGGVSYIGFSWPGTACSTVVDLSGTSEMHVGTSGVMANVHMGLGTDNTGTINMIGDSKVTVDITGVDYQPTGWFNIGDLGGTGNINLSGNASLSVTQANMGMGCSDGGKGHVTLNDTSSFTVGRYVHLSTTSTSESTITLNGGTFTALGFIGAGSGSAINFNGGTIKASGDNAAFITGTTVVGINTGGAKIDSNGHSVTVANQIGTLAVSTDGGLTKTGLGTLVLAANCTYTGATVVDKGTLHLSNIELATSGITVKSTGTLSGTTNQTDLISYPTTTVQSGGTLAGNTPGPDLQIAGLYLEQNSTLKYAFTDLGFTQPIWIDGSVLPSGASSSNVVVDFTGSPLSDVPILRVGGTLSPQLSFALPGGKPVLDSPDGVNTPAYLDVTSGLGGNVTLKAGGIINDPHWTVAAGGNWTDTTWQDASGNPVAYPNGSGKRAMFTKNLSTFSVIPINLNVSPLLSSMVFASPSGESYNISAGSGNFITLDSSSAQNWHITVLSGSHTVGANIKMAKGTDQAAIKVPVGSQLTLGGVLSNETTDAAGFNFVSTGTLTGNQWDGTIAITHGVLTLNGANTFTGPVAMSGYGRLELGNPTALGTGTANFTLDGSLAYTGAPSSPTTVTIDRSLTFAGAGFLNNIEVQNANVNLKFTGPLAKSETTNAFRKTGAGTLTFSNSGTNTLASGDFQIEEGNVVFENGVFNKERVNIGFQNGSGDFFVGDTAGKAATLTVQNGAALNNQGVINVGTNNGGTGTLALSGSATATGLILNLGVSGTGNLTLGGTSTTAPTKLSINGRAYMGFRDPGNPSGVASSATIDLTGTAELHIGTDGPTANTHLGLGTDSTGTINMSGDSKLIVGLVGVEEFPNGWFNIGDLGGTANINLSGNASFTLPQTNMGLACSTGGIAHVTLAGSSSLNLGRDIKLGGWDLAGTEAIVNLNGGTLTTRRIDASHGSGVVNFNGGTLRAATAAGNVIPGVGATYGDNFLVGTTMTANVQSGGAKIDTNGVAVTISRTLQHDTTPGAPALDGGVTKLGTGALTLSNSANGYTGGTNIAAGKVVSAVPGCLGTGNVSFTGTNTTLTVGYAVPVNGITGFGSTGTGWSLNGTAPASVASDVLTITPAANDQANSAIFNKKVSSHDFTASFTYQEVTGGDVADGFTFMLQNNGTSVVGGLGGGLGYSGIGNSLALEGNIFSGAGGSGLKLALNGEVGGYASTAPVDLANSASPVNVTLTYHDATQTLDVALDQPGVGTYSTSYTGVDLSAFAETYVGFTGGTGGLNAQQNISNFAYASTIVTPSATYANGLVVNAGVAASVNVQASTYQSTVTMGNLSMASGASLSVAPETGSTANLAYGLTLGSATLSGPATLNIADNGTGKGKLTLTGTLSGTGPLTKAGAGTLELTGPIANIGNVTISGGLLQVNNGSTTNTLGAISGAGSLKVASGSSLTVTSLRVGTLAPAGASAVPEPGTFALLALAAVCAGMAWRKRQ